jgi:hypothetical protein
MECPKCGAYGEVPLDKIGKRLHCRKCNTFFHVDSSGNVHLGGPEDAKKAEKSRLVEVGDVDVDLNPWHWVRDASKTTKAVMGLVIAAAILVGTVRVAARSFGMPQDPAGRAQYLGERFVDMQLEAIKPMARADSERAVTDWYNLTRSTLPLKEPRKEKSEATVLTVIVNQSETEAQTLTTVSLAKPPAGGVGTMAYPLVWKRSRNDSSWKVDFNASVVAWKDQLRRNDRSRAKEMTRNVAHSRRATMGDQP